jgi:hypothetical protein
VRRRTALLVCETVVTRAVQRARPVRGHSQVLCSFTVHQTFPSAAFGVPIAVDAGDGIVELA